ncbi:dihydrodipicolinate synthase family protein [Alsobacter sp. R-9]
MSRLSSSITVDAIRGIVGILPTPSTPDADHWSCEQSVDLEATAAMVRMVVDAGVGILMTGGSFGEGPTLTWREHRAFTDAIVQAHGGKALLFAGVTTLNTRDTIERARGLVALGADGLFLGRPMWMAMDHPAIVRFYADVAEACPGVPIVVYDNEFAFKGKIATETYRELSRNRSIVATKHIGGPSIVDDLLAVEGRMRVLPIDAQWGKLARAHPDAALACWTGNVADGPEPLVALARAVEARDWDRADHIGARMWWAQAPMFPGGKLENFVDYNIPIAHGRLWGSKLVRTGPPRPPYLFAPDGHVEGGIETGRRWESLRREFPLA